VSNSLLQRDRFLNGAEILRERFAGQTSGRPPFHAFDLTFRPRILI
jgi:hypothetical protein